MTSRIRKGARWRRRGFTFVEAMLLIAVLGIGAAAVGRALTAMAHTPEQNDNELATETALLDKMEYLHSLSFSTLAADAGKMPSQYTDTVAVGQSYLNRSVSIDYVSPSTGEVSSVATHMLQITVSIGVKSVVTLVNQP